VSIQDSTPVQPPLSDLGAGNRPAVSASLDTLLDVSMPVIIEMGRASMTVQEVLQLGGGSVIQLDRLVGEPVDIYVGDRRLAQGEVVVVGDHLGVRVTSVLGSQNGEAAA
jgi:flagellar motor switch protein FliN/FliY